ncbi:MAG TPA: DUF1565 domain-containing protein, partial [Thermoplasmata archaeon]|nr:DUF1565 domain-containing protein [Thermoplasmata archaeon]
MGRYSVVMAAGFFLLILFMSSPGAVARTIYVDVSNHGDPSMNGSAAHPYDGISKAVDNASTSDLVIVANGTYNDSVTIDRAITVRGNGSTVVSPGSSGVAITIDENYVTVDGLNITHAKYGIEVSADHATLWNLTIKNCQHGIHIQSHSDIAIANVTITDSKEGVWITGSSYITLTDVEATDNEDDGVYLSLTDNCTIDGGRFSDNDQRGIFLESSGGDIVIRDCEVRDNDYYGIAMVSDSSGNRIEGVTVSGSAWGLYFFSNSDDNTVIGSTVTGNDVNIYIRNCDGETIKASDVGGGTTRNIHLFNSEGNRIIDSDALPGSVLLEFQSDLVATNTSIWNEVIDDEDSRLVVKNWVIVRVVTSPPSSFGIEDADVRIVDRNGTDNRTVFATPHFGGTNAT